MDKSVGELAVLVGGVVVGDPSVRITGLNGIQQAQRGELTFVGNRRYLPYLGTTAASAVLVAPDAGAPERTLIQVKNPYLAFVRVLQEYAASAPIPHPTGIHETAVVGRNVSLGQHVALDAHVRIADNCVIGDNVVLYAGVYVGDSSCIENDTVVYPNVSIRERTRIGARCIIHAGVVLGSDGFGFAPVNGTWFKVPQVGTVRIGDDVEIGANTAIDRATFGTTVIGCGTKIDNLVQIGHNVEIGEHCVISGMTGVAGSTRIGCHVTIAAQVGIADHMEIGDNVTIAGRSGVTHSVASGQVVSGFPAIDHETDKRVVAGLRRLPELPRRVRELERRIQKLEEELHGKAANHRD